MSGGVPIPVDGSVELLHTRLDRDPAWIENHEGCLSPSERYLANRRVTAELRRRAIVSRALLRRALGHALGHDPSEISLAIGPQGKPFLVDPTDAARLDFNLSHSGEHWLLALGTRGPLGIDLETPRDETDWDALVERYFSAAERATFATLPAPRRKEAFFRIWTAKEAFLKARGSGLATPLAEFDVEANPDRPLRLLDARIDGVRPEDWWIVEVAGLPLPAALSGQGPIPERALRTEGASGPLTWTPD